MTSKRTQQGLTLIEIIVVIGIITLIVSFGTIIDLSVFNQDTFNTEEAKIVSALERARSQAMANLFDSSYGFCYLAPNYIIFKGGTCVAAGNDLIPANIKIASNPATVFPTFVFDRLTGNTTSDIINIEDGIKSADIEINDEGTISW